MKNTQKVKVLTNKAKSIVEERGKVRWQFASQAVSQRVETEDTSLPVDWDNYRVMMKVFLQKDSEQNPHCTFYDTQENKNQWWRSKETETEGS